MKKFTLTATYEVMRDLQTQVCLKPTDTQIENYLATYRVYESESIAIAETPNFITEMTPLLFAEFQQMDNVPQSIRDEFEL
jgi:hypothetical protein